MIGPSSVSVDLRVYVAACMQGVCVGNRSVRNPFVFSQLFAVLFSVLSSNSPPTFSSCCCCGGVGVDGAACDGGGGDGGGGGGMLIIITILMTTAIH